MSDQMSVPPCDDTFGRISVFHNVQPVVEKPKEACARSGHGMADHFAEIRNMVDIGSGAQREIEIGDLQNELVSVRTQLAGYLKEFNL